MNKPDVSPTGLAISPISFPDFRSTRRLIVLIPESLADSARVAGKIWELAKALESRVQLIGLCKDVALEPSLRRQFVFLSAMISDGFVSVESKIEFGSNWLKVVKSNWREGDVLVCFDGQYMGLMHRPLSQFIESTLKLNVYVLDGFYKNTSFLPKWFSTVIAWGGSLGTMAVFFWMQVQIIQLPVVWAQNVLMCFSILVEVGLIWGWNALFP